MIHIRENMDKAHNMRPQKRLNYKDLSEGRSPTQQENNLTNHYLARDPLKYI